MSAVPLLALAPNWQIAGLLIIAERVGKAIRNPPRDVMLSHAAKQMGYGWGFGVHEALDQSGALFGPLVVAAVLARHGDYRAAFAALLIPAALTLTMLVVARMLYPRPEDLEASVPDMHAAGLPRVFWIYLAGAALVAAGFADFTLIAFHFEKANVIPNTWVPVFYSIAMAASGMGSLLFGRLFDRTGFWILLPLTVIAAASSPLVFFGRFWLALIGSALWGVGMGVHESIIPAAVAAMVPQQRRPSAYGIFTAGYGIFWFIGSVIIGRLYDVSVSGLIVFSVAAQLAAIPFFLSVRRRLRAKRDGGELRHCKGAQVSNLPNGEDGIHASVARQQLQPQKRSVVLLLAYQVPSPSVVFNGIALHVLGSSFHNGRFTKQQTMTHRFVDHMREN
ncbi:MAG TPA: MFS transporter [Candidatus Eisenbacteria bacterium]|nr:MFS transporter [Candidatus Eisenbacteria bacterium]